MNHGVVMVQMPSEQRMAGCDADISGCVAGCVAGCVVGCDVDVASL